MDEVPAKTQRNHEVGFFKIIFSLCFFQLRRMFLVLGGLYLTFEGNVFGI